MPYDFLQTTTIEPQLEEQQRLMDMLTSQAAAQQQDNNNPQDLQEIQDQDLSDLEEQDETSPDNEHEELTDSEANAMATDTHDFENQDVDETDYQLMGYLMGDSGQEAPQRQYGGGSLANASTVYSQQTGVDWLRDRTNNIKFQNLNKNASRYQLPQQQEKEDDYNSVHNQATQFIQNDPIAQRMGIDVMKKGGKKSGAYNVDYKTGGNRYQFGGKTLFADDYATLRQGLNNDNYQRAVLKLAGTNTIRGLDNQQPVAVTDGSKYKVLHGPKDTAQFKGNVYEKRL